MSERQARIAFFFQLIRFLVRPRRVDRLASALKKLNQFAENQIQLRGTTAMIEINQ